MKSGVIGLFAVLTALTTLGCGGSLGSAQTQDVANVLAGFGKSSPGTTPPPAAPLVRLVNESVTGAAWLGRFEAQTFHPRLAAFSGGCPASQSYEGMSCTSTCPNTSKAIDTCSSSTTYTASCGGTSYTISNISMTTTIDFTNVNEDARSGSDYNGPLVLGLNLSANVSGGNLSGGQLSCNVSVSVEMSTMAYSFDCSNFSCTYGGTDVDCSTLQSMFASTSSCTI